MLHTSFATASRPTTEVVFSTGCTPFFDWQAIGLAYSHQHVRQPGSLTRLVSECADEEARQRTAGLPIARAHEHPDFGTPRVNGVADAYPPYNKAGGVAHWLADAAEGATTAATDGGSHFVLLLEADMLLRQPIDCAALGVRPGRAASSRVEYLSVVRHGMARSFVKNVHLVQAVGGWACLHREDMRRLAPLWLQMTKLVRKNPQRYWHLPGDPTSVAEDVRAPVMNARARAGTRGHARARAPRAHTHISPPAPSEAPSLCSGLRTTPPLLSSPLFSLEVLSRSAISRFVFSVSSDSSVPLWLSGCVAIHVMRACVLD